MSPPPPSILLGKTLSIIYLRFSSVGWCNKWRSPSCSSPPFCIIVSMWFTWPGTCRFSSGGKGLVGDDASCSFPPFSDELLRRKEMIKSRLQFNSKWSNVLAEWVQWVKPHSVHDHLYVGIIHIVRPASGGKDHWIATSAILEITQTWRFLYSLNPPKTLGGV